MGDTFWNGYNASIPLASLRLEEDKCVLTWSFFWIKYTSYTIHYNELTEVSVKRFLYSKGFVFTHTNKNIPKYLLFWSDVFWGKKNTNRIFDALKQKEIKVL